MERLNEGRSTGYPAALPVPADCTPSEAERLRLLRERREQAEANERRRQVRGLLLAALAVLIFSILRAGAGNVFPRGWWRLW